MSFGLFGRARVARCASLDVAVVIEDGKEVEANVEDVAVDCDLSCDVDGYRVDEEIIVEASGVIKKKTLSPMWMNLLK